MLKALPIIFYLLVFSWHTKDYNKSWGTWKYKWWTGGLVTAEILIQFL